MIRKQEIVNAARKYIDTVIFSLPSDVIYFEAGAEWADEHPINVWHDASEEPRYEEFLLVEESNEFNVYKLSGQEDNSWELLVSAMGIIRWAYIKDLLPKQFVNSEQPKGDER